MVPIPLIALFTFVLCAGTIEIINDVHILKPGDKVGASEATLLNMLNISPFSYGLVVKQVLFFLFHPPKH